MRLLHPFSTLSCLLQRHALFRNWPVRMDGRVKDMVLFYLIAEISLHVGDAESEVDDDSQIPFML